MKKLLLIGSLLVLNLSQAQDRTEIWLGAGIKTELSPKWVLAAGSNLRMRTDGKLQTLFQDVSIKSTHLKWFRPSLELRFITSYDKAGNYSNSPRINVNLDFRKEIKEFKFGTRLRYQAGFGGDATSAGDLDRAMRIKPYFTYSIKESRFTPGFSTEFFYNPANSATGNRFNRMRMGFSCDIDVPGPHEIGVTYYYGRKFNSGRPYNEYLFSLEYVYNLKFDKKKKK